MAADRSKLSPSSLAYYDKAMDRLASPRRRALAELSRVRALGATATLGEAKALDPSLRVEELRGIYGKLSDFELNAIDEAAKAVGNEGERAALVTARHDYQALSLAERAAGNNVDRYMTNRNMGLSEYMAMGASVAAGHPLAAPVVGVVHKVVRARGNAFLAASFSRLSALQAIARRTEAVDTQIARGLRGVTDRIEGKVESRGGLVGGEAPKGKRIKLRTISRADSKKETQERYDNAVTNVTEAAKGSLDATPAIESLAPHAPQVSQSFSRHVQTAATWLATQVPKPPKWGSRTPSELEQHQFLTKVDAVDHPVDAILGGLGRGDLTQTQVTAVKNGQPAMYDDLTKQISAKVQTMLAKDRRIPYGVKRDLALLFDMPTDYSMTPEGVSMLQDNLSPPASGKPGGAPMGGPQMGPKRAVKTPLADEIQTPTQRRMGGQIR